MDPYEEFKSQFLSNMSNAVPGAPSFNPAPSLPEGYYGLEQAVVNARPGKPLPVNQQHLNYLAQQLIMSAFPQMNAQYLNTLTPQQLTGSMAMAQNQGFAPKTPSTPSYAPPESGFNTPSFGGFLEGTRDALNLEEPADYTGLPPEVLPPPQGEQLGPPMPGMEPSPPKPTTPIDPNARTMTYEEVQQIRDMQGEPPPDLMQSFLDKESEVNTLQRYVEQQMNPNPADQSRLTALRNELETIRVQMKPYGAQGGSIGSVAGSLLMGGLGLMDKPRQLQAAQVGEQIYKKVANGQQIEGFWLDDLLNNLLAYGGSGFHEILSLGSAESLAEWFNDPANKEAIIAAHDEGFGQMGVDTDGDGDLDVIGPAFTGGRAIMELYASTQGAASRGLYDIVLDPTVYAGIFTKPLYEGGESLINAAARDTIDMGDQAGSAAFRQGVGEVMQVPHKVYTSLDVPVSGMIDVARQLIPGGQTLTDAALAQQQAQNWVDQGGWATGIAGMAPPTTQLGPNDLPLPGSPQPMPPGALPPGPEPSIPNSVNPTGPSAPPQQIADALGSGAYNNEGATVSRSLDPQPANGFSVADGSRGIVIENPLGTNGVEIQRQINELIEANPDQDWWGSWLDMRGNRLYVDPVNIVGTYDDAVRLGIYRNELEIFNFDTFTSFDPRKTTLDEIMSIGRTAEAPPTVVPGQMVQPPLPAIGAGPGQMVQPPPGGSARVLTKQEWYDALEKRTLTVGDVRLGGGRIVDDAWQIAQSNPDQGRQFFDEMAPKVQEAESLSRSIDIDKTFNYDHNIDPHVSVTNPKVGGKRTGKTFIPTEKQVKNGLPWYQLAADEAEAYVRSFGKALPTDKAYITQKIPKNADARWYKAHPMATVQEALFGPTESAARAFKQIGEWRKAAWGMAGDDSLRGLDGNQIVDEIEVLRNRIKAARAGKVYDTATKKVVDVAPAGAAPVSSPAAVVPSPVAPLTGAAPSGVTPAGVVPKQPLPGMPPVDELQDPALLRADPRNTGENVTGGELIGLGDPRSSQYLSTAPTTSYIEPSQPTRMVRRLKDAVRQIRGEGSHLPPGYSSTNRMSQSNTEIKAVLDRDEGLPDELINHADETISRKGEAQAIKYGDDGAEVYVYGGVNDGEFSLRELLMLDSQQFNPALLDRVTNRKLYHKLFKSIQAATKKARSGMVPGQDIELARRMTLGVFSGNTNLVNTQSITSQMVRTWDDVENLARIADELDAEDAARRAAGQPIRDASEKGIEVWTRHLGYPPPGKGTNPVFWWNAQGMRNLVNDPEWFVRRKGEDLITYTERVVSRTPGAKAKVGAFMMEVEDPLNYPMGAMDMWAARDAAEWAVRNMKAEDLIETFKIGQAGDMFKRYGLVNDDYSALILGRNVSAMQPQELGWWVRKKMDEPWMHETRPGDTMLKMGTGDYKVFNDVFGRMKNAEGMGDWGTGAYQWYRWDLKRGIFEGHPAAWPGGGVLPRRPPEEMRAALTDITESGYHTAIDRAPTPRKPGSSMYAAQQPDPVTEALSRRGQRSLDARAQRGFGREDELRETLPTRFDTGEVDIRIETAVREQGMPMDYARGLNEKIVWDGQEMTVLDVYGLEAQKGLRSAEETAIDLWAQAREQGILVPGGYLEGLQQAVPLPDAAAKKAFDLENEARKAKGLKPKRWKPPTGRQLADYASIPSTLFRQNVMFNPISGPAAAIRDGMTNTFNSMILNGWEAGMASAKNMPKLVGGYSPEQMVNDVTARTYGPTGLPGPPTQFTKQFAEAKDLVGGDFPMIQEAADKFTRMMGGGDKAAQVARGAMTPLATRWVKMLRQGADVVSRVFSGEALYIKHLRDARMDWLLGVRRSLESKGMDHFEINRIMANLTGMGAESNGTRLFSPQDVSRALKGEIPPGQIEQYVRSWSRLRNEANVASRVDVDRVLFSYRQTKADSKLGKVLVFHYWQSRAIQNTAHMLARNPWMIRVGLEMQEFFSSTSEIPGLPSYMRGMWRFMGDGGAFMFFLDPINALIPFATFREAAKADGDVRVFDQVAEAVGVSPMVQAILSSAGVSQPYQAPNFLGNSAVAQATTAGADVLRNYVVPAVTGDTSNMGLSDQANPMNWPQELANKGVEEINQMLVDSRFDDAAAALGIDSLIQTQEFANVGSSRLSRVNEIVTDLYMKENNIGVYDFTHDPEHVMALAEIIDSRTSGDPHPLMQEALQMETQNLATRRVVNTLSPLPILSGYGPQIERGAMRSGEIPATENVTSTLYDLRDLATTGTPLLSGQQAGYERVGTAREREASAEYNDLAYGSYADLVDRYGATEVIQFQNGETIPLYNLSNMEREERVDYIDSMIAGTSVSSELDSYKGQRDEFLGKNPDLKRYTEWRTDYGRLNDGDIIATRDLMMSASPAYKTYVNHLKPSDRENFGSLFSLDGYRAWTGKPMTIYRSSDGQSSGAASADLTMAMQDRLMGASSGGSKPKTPEEKAARLNEDMLKYESEMQLYNKTVTGILGADPSTLHPLWAAAAANDPRLQGIPKPDTPSGLGDYLKWRDANLAANPNSNVTPLAYFRWLEQFGTRTNTAAD